MTLPLQTSWPSGIDLDGLNASDRKRIAEIGLDNWLTEVCTPNLKLTHKFMTGPTVAVELPKNKVSIPRFTLPKDSVMEVLQQTMPKDEVASTKADLHPKPYPVVGKKGQFLADEFIRIAKANNGIVTLDEATKVNPKAPSDLAYYARLRGAEIKTEKKRVGKTQWILVKE